MTKTVEPDTGAAAWGARAFELADWAWARAVNRTDVWGGYLPLAERGKEIEYKDRVTGTVKKIKLTGPTTRPPRRERGLVKLTRHVFVRHFAASAPEHVVGTHTTSPENTSLYGAVEIDWHGEQSADPAKISAAGLAWYNRLVSRGHRPLLTDSNGKGGLHLTTYLRSAVDTPRMWGYLRRLTDDFWKYGLLARPEQFPKQRGVSDRSPYGNWLRLVGRHHTREHWSRVWGGERWLEGAEAVAYILTIEGDDPGLIPAWDEMPERVHGYIDKLPTGMPEGSGRDNVAFNLLAFLARDLKLSDQEALDWAEEWDQRNAPPKGRQRLQEILQNVHEYGQRAYGSGRDRTHPNGTAGHGTNGVPGGERPGPEATAAPPPPPQDTSQRTGHEIILDDLGAKYQPIFRRGVAVYSATLRREVKMGEATSAPTYELIQKLASALDAPRDKKGNLKPEALPAFFGTWSRVAWGTLFHGLPDEEVAEETAVSAEEEFRGKVSAALLSQVTLGETRHQQGHDPVMTTQRRSLIEWCKIFAKSGPWKSIRSYPIWTRTGLSPGGVIELQVGLRVELFTEIKFRELSSYTQNAFGRLCERYGVGEQGRAQGQRAVLLNHDFILSLFAGPADEPIPAPEREPGEEG